jgi:hypothetical protein
MEPENYRFGGGSSSTLLHPLVALVMVLTIVLVLCLPRKYVIVPMLLASLLIPRGQVVVLAGLHFTVVRIILLAGLARWAASGRSSPLAGGFNFMDRVVTLWALSVLVIFSLQWMNSQALVKSVGDFLDALGSYFVLRFLIQDREDVRRTIKTAALVAILMGVCMLNEQRTGMNVFGLLGGVRAFSEVRNGSIRSQAAFLHSITAGSFGATLVPLLIWLWSDAKSRVVAVLGLLGATAMTFTPHSSTITGCYAAGILGLCLWPIRKWMRVIRWGIALSLIGLHLVMHGPVWSLLEHINLTGSSESFHRYQLVDTFIRHFWDWWLLGTRDNGSWGWEMADTSNQYVTYGISGGLAAFVLFIAIISRGFGRLGTARKIVDGNRREEWFLWCLGVAMFAHVVVYFGIDYFDQMAFAWFMFLAIISVAVFEATRPPATRDQGASSLGTCTLVSEPSAGWGEPHGKELPREYVGPGWGDA